MFSFRAHNHLKVGRAGKGLMALLCTVLLWFSISASHAQQGGAPAESRDASYEALADLLEDRQMREQLIQQLRSRAGEADAEAAAQPSAASRPAGSSPPAQTPGKPEDTIPGALQAFAAGMKSDIAETWLVVKALATGNPVPANRMEQWRPALAGLAIAIISALLAYVLLRLAASYAFRRMNDWVMLDAGKPPQPAAPVQEPGKAKRRLKSLALGRKLLAVIGAFAVDIAVVALAALAAYAAVILFASPGASASLFAMQFLTAFVLVESSKAVSRAVFSTRYDQLRLLPLSSETAAYWNRWLIILIAAAGYSLMVAVPVAQALLSEGTGRLLGLVLMLMVYLYAISMVWRNRREVSEGLRAYAEKSAAPVFGTLLRILARIWHWMVLTYFTVFFIVSQTNQQHAFDFMFHATVQTIVAVLAGLLLSAILSALLARHINLPDNWRKALPLLEARVNAYVPAFLRSLRLLILIVVVLVVLDAWRIFDLAGWLGSENGQKAVGTLIHVGIILLVAALVWTVLASIIEHRLGISTGKNRPTEREKTLLMLFRSAASAVIATLTVLVVLSQIGIDIGPLIAGAGVVGLAIGFGAQKLVQDVITGIFIQLENGMNQNDIVEVVGLFGTVEKITIRSVAIRTLDGGYHLIPFSTIDKVSNHTRDYGYHFGEYNIGHRENVDEAVKQLEQAFAELKQDPELASEILEDISIPGVTALNERGFTIRVLIKTTPGMQWAVQRAFNRLVKKYFDAAGIEIPYPHTVLQFGRGKDGHIEPADARTVEALSQAVGRPPVPERNPKPLPSEETKPDMP